MLNAGLNIWELNRRMFVYTAIHLTSGTMSLDCSGCNSFVSVSLELGTMSGTEA